MKKLIKFYCPRFSKNTREILIYFKQTNLWNDRKILKPK